MKMKVLLVAGLLFAGTIAASHAGGRWNCGPRWGGGWGGYWGGPTVSIGWGGGGYWGGRPYWGPGYCAPRPYYGWGWGAPAVRVVTYAPVVTTSYVTTRKVQSGRSSLVAAAQEELAGLGYYGGAIDGAFGPRTSAAVQRFQRDYGLAVTGRLDAATRASLGI
jgi:hypothetical protein